MSIVEQRIIWLGMAIMLAYLAVYQFFFIPQFSGSEPYVGEAAIAYLGWFTVGTTFACVVLLLRDLKRRDISGKPGWFIGIVIFTWVGLPYYFFKHARRPLPNAIMNQPQGLISVLLDHTASISERDGAAMDLEEYKHLSLRRR